MKYIAVLMTVFNRKQKTLACLDNLFAQVMPAGYKMDVWLTNDGCTDGTADAVRDSYPQVNIVEGDGTLYWNRGMHRAWTAAIAGRDYDYYLWLNDDTFLYDGAVSKLLETSEKCDNKSNIVGTTCAVGRFDILTYGGRLAKGEILKPDDTLQECQMINGNIVLVPRYVYEHVGMNDPIFCHAIGDSDYGWRVVEAGLKNIIAPEVLGECDAHEIADTWCNPQKTLVTRWRALRRGTGVYPEQLFIFERRHYGLATACFHYVTTHLHCLFPGLWNVIK